MTIQETSLKGAFILTPDIFTDSRGYFLESYNQKVIESFGLKFKPIQDNESFSTHGVIRGLHFQKGDAAQSKLIRVISGEIREAIFDLRKNSPTFLQKFELTINSSDKRQLFVPKGLAHGFAVLSDSAIVHYKVDNHFSPQAEGGLNVHDDQLAIDWGIRDEEKIISDKDKLLPSLRELNYSFQ